jgi:hypothetical protein
MNVDLEIFSTSDPSPLVKAWGPRVVVLHSDRVKRTHRVFLEVAQYPKSADQAIRTFCKLIESLPRVERKLWDGAKKRDFSIGIGAGLTPSAQDFALSAKTVQAVANVSARIVLTVYAAERPALRRGTSVRAVGLIVTGRQPFAAVSAVRPTARTDVRASKIARRSSQVREMVQPDRIVDEQPRGVVDTNR